MQLTQARALVTGGASGLGEAVVRLFVAQGARAVIVDVNEEKGAALAAELGPAVRFARADVSSESEMQAAVALAVADFGGLDILVNCAGIGLP
ncbi:MAG: SDR family NAD(P)-dependent oxidoreductase, partial [Anaerolineae bacterium]|nr:SDR family NAD(P)-dependent oxidoreductase [Anaerolineae bacterium]